jgi:hypothetical protein
VITELESATSQVQKIVIVSEVGILQDVSPPQFCLSGLVNLLSGAGKYGKIWSACRQHEIKYTE